MGERADPGGRLGYPFGVSTQSETTTMSGEGRRSATSRTLLLAGAAVVGVGVLVSMLGLAGVHAFDIAVKSFAFDSTSTGFMAVAFGGALVAGVALDRPDDDLHSSSSAAATAAERAQRRVALPAVVVMALGFLLFVASILF
jgi:hypothetical protein